ncbi:PQQ-dependent sugar dehydrogenase [Dyadobacter psychrotolerans]|uniref:C-type cytochrome n=1 Tax=Dyadobacter psychrotolerans TaxID=2541721 RepID=A0A4R5DSU9_9BACT|nr:PQQ-dependent sugar dehydrogenase [Dyadobacter psychrotolerans]TDE15434.1 c-type cytochrome [Dyadobacter psychrotolerans]
MLRTITYFLQLLFLLSFLTGCLSGKKTRLLVPDKQTLSQKNKLQQTLLQGKELFTTNCVSCHNMQDDGIGPRLGGVTTLLAEQHLIDFIKNPAKIIEGGDKRAASLNRKYKMVMPSFDFLADSEIKSILSYLDSETREKAIQPLVVKEEITANTIERLTSPVSKSGLRIEVEDFVSVPASSEKMPKTRIANMRPHPSGDGSVFVSDQRGIIYRISNKEVNMFFDIRSLIENYINEPGLGTGLGSFAFHPDYLQNGLIYITHTEAFKGKRADYFYADSIKVAMQWVVSEWKIKDVKSTVFEGTRRELLRINVPNNVHGTQDIEFIPGLKKGDKDYGLLYIGTGDGGSTISKHPELCHNLHSLLGTIIRIDPLGNNSKNGNYGIPVDNPFVTSADPDVRKEIYAYGFRNPHRLSWDSKYGNRLFSSDVGEVNFEEVNAVVKGGDYGWNNMEGNYGISPKDLKNVFPVSKSAQANAMVPFARYDHIDGNAISGGYVYEGNLEALNDKYLFGDIVKGRLFYININKALSDSTIHELMIVQNGQETSLEKMSGSKRVDLRIEYNPFTHDLFIMTKSDGKIRRVTKAFVEKLP